MLDSDGPLDTWVTFTVGVDRQVDTRQLWTPGFAARRLRVNWTTISLDELLAYSLDPAQDPELKALLLPSTLCLLAQLGQLLDEAVESMANSSRAPPRSSARKKFIALAVMQKRAVADRMFHGKALGSGPHTKQTLNPKRVCNLARSMR